MFVGKIYWPRYFIIGQYDLYELKYMSFRENYDVLFMFLLTYKLGYNYFVGKIKTGEKHH